MGVLTIGIVLWALWTYNFTTTFFLIMNEYVKWWFPMVTLILMIPSFTSVCFFIGWFTKDCKRTRGTLVPGLILSLISLSLVALWRCSYYLWMYKADEVYTGYGDDTTVGYKSMTKKAWIFWILTQASVSITLYAYFLCVVNKYVDSLAEEKDEPEAEEKKDDK
jgi:hypothetical protein